MKHWIWTNDKYLKCWLWFLLRANHSDTKILMGAELIDLNRGEFVTSIQKIAIETKMTSQNIRTFLKLLEKDSMIAKKSTSKLTKITILKYDSYQDSQQTDNKQITNKQQANNKPVTTDNNNNNNNNDNKFDFKKSLLELNIDKNIVEDWMKVRKNKKATNTQTSFNKIKSQIEKSGRSANECIEIAVSKDWKGFEAEWINKNKINENNKEYNPHDRGELMPGQSAKITWD